jgi:carboxylate-amine ligase
MTPLLAGVAERFDGATDFTVGIEEEYQLLDLERLDLVNRYEELHAAAEPELAAKLAGELISSEIEFRTGAHATFAAAARELVEGRLATIALADRLGIATAVTGVHPWSPWTEQHIIDTPHYAKRDRELGYIAWINNTWSIHLHAGVRGADRAVAVSTALRSVLPELLALSANSAVYVGRPTRLASTRTQIFTRSFPRCGVPEVYRDWAEYRDFVALLERTGSISEARQIWWSVRPAHDFGTIEIRICDGQTEMAEALGLAALMLACVAAFCLDHDEGRPIPAHSRALIEENLWRAQRYGLEGELIDLDVGTTRPTRAAIERLLEWSAPVHEPLGLRRFLASVPATLSQGNGAMRQIARLDELGDLRAVHAEAVERTRRSAEDALDLVGAVASA